MKGKVAVIIFAFFTICFLSLCYASDDIITEKQRLQEPILKVQRQSYNSLKIYIDNFEDDIKYTLERKINGKYKTIAVLKNKEYIDKNLIVGKKYFYRVEAEYNESKKMSKVVSNTPMLDKTIINVSKSKSHNSVYLKWEKVDGASGYKIYRSTAKDGKYIAIKNINSLSYIDKDLITGKTYYYRVRAYKTVGKKTVYGPYSNKTSAKPILASPSFNISQNNTHVKVTISTSKGATGYEIYKKDVNDNVFKKVATTTSRVYKDEKINFLTTYEYKVRAYKVIGKKKVYSGFSAIKEQETYIPKPNMALERSQRNSVDIYWDGINKIDGYEIYVSKNDEQYTLIKDISSSKAGKIVLKNLEYDTTVSCKMRAYKTIDNQKTYGDFCKVIKKTVTQFATALRVKNNASVYKGAGINYKVLGVVKKDQIVASLDKVGNYYKIYINGKVGYINKNNVKSYSNARLLYGSNINQFSNLGGPILPTGCEATSLAIVLQYLGFRVTKNELADKYMPKGKVGKTDPNVAFVGSPYSESPYGCYAPVIVKTANNYFNTKNNNKYSVNNLTGTNIENIHKQIDEGNIVIMWMTIGYPYYQNKWTLNYGTKTSKEGKGTYSFIWYGYQHCVAVIGYNKKNGNLIVADVGYPGELKEYTISYLKAGYNRLGKQIVTITKNKYFLES